MALTFTTQIAESGEFKRRPTAFHQWVTADGSSGFKAEAGRYHLYVSHACPWAHRTLVMRKLKGLEKAIDFSVVHWKLGEGGWHFDDEFPDHLEGRQRLREVYLETEKEYVGSITVPVLYDKVTKKIVNNESSEIIRILNKEFNAFSATPERACRPFAPNALLILCLQRPRSTFTPRLSVPRSMPSTNSCTARSTTACTAPALPASRSPMRRPLQSSLPRSTRWRAF